jgi:GDP-D-mannose dehydratase
MDVAYLAAQSWKAAYLTFAEQRIYDSNIDYITPNYIYTLEIIQQLLNRTKKIVCYTTCELWNNLSGYIAPSTAPDFSPLTNEYCLSKLLLWNKIKELRQVNDAYNKVIFIHPFYFNSIYRSSYFLFGKIFASILERKPVEVGNLNFYRDIVHAKLVVQQSIQQQQDCVVGSGRLTNVREFVKDLYRLNDMNFEEMVRETSPFPSGKEKLIMAQVNWDYTYQDLLRDTQEDITQYRKEHGYDRQPH